MYFGTSVIVLGNELVKFQVSWGHAVWFYHQNNVHTMPKFIPDVVRIVFRLNKSTNLNNFLVQQSMSIMADQDLDCRMPDKIWV